MTDRECCIACNCISGIGYNTFKALLDVFGKPGNIPGHAPSEYLAAKGVGKKTAELLSNTDFELACAREINRSEIMDVKIITICDADYPSLLRETPNPPIALYVAGRLPENFSGALGIVGSRRISKYAQEQTRNIAMAAAQNGMVIVSGMAAGADGCAHRAALDAGGITVGIIGAGLENIYPAEHADMAKEIIASGGALISELPMQFPVTPTGFPRRNRIIAGLSRGILVTEASVDSGSMITADFAVKYNRMLFAIPGRVDNPNTSGCHKLIKEGAFLVDDFRDIAGKFGMVTAPQSAVPKEETPALELTDAERCICNHIRQGTDSFDMLVISTNMPVHELTYILMSLEMRGVITREDSQTYRLIIQ